MRWIILLLCLGCHKRELPVIDTAGFEPMIVAQIDSAAAKVRDNPRSSGAWGNLGMVLHAYELHAPARLCYQHAHTLDRKNPQSVHLQRALDTGLVPPEVTDLRIGLKAWSDKA